MLFKEMKERNCNNSCYYEIYQLTFYDCKDLKQVESNGEKT